MFTMWPIYRVYIPRYRGILRYSWQGTGLSLPPGLPQSAVPLELSWTVLDWGNKVGKRQWEQWKEEVREDCENKTTVLCFCSRVWFFFFIIKAECHNAVSLLLRAISFHKPKNTVTSQSLCWCKHNAMSPSLCHTSPLNLEHNGDVLLQRGLRGEKVEKWTDRYSDWVCYIEPVDSERFKQILITSWSLSVISTVQVVTSRLLYASKILISMHEFFFLTVQQLTASETWACF